MATINRDRITDVAIATVAAMDDLDSARGLRNLRSTVICYGHHQTRPHHARRFSNVHFDWRSASRTARAARIRSWLNMEHHHYG